MYVWVMLDIQIFHPRELNSVGRDVAFYMQGLGFELRTLQFSTIKSPFVIAFLRKKIITFKSIVSVYYRFLKKIRI